MPMRRGATQEARQDMQRSGGAARRRAPGIGGSLSGPPAGVKRRGGGWGVGGFRRGGGGISGGGARGPGPRRIIGNPRGRGAGIVAQPELIATLKALGLDTRDLGVEVATRQILDAEGRLAGRVDCPQTLTAWERVYRILRDAFPPERYHRGIGLKGFAQSERSVVAQLTQGSAEGDLLVGADGLRSTVRRRCLPDLAPLYAGYVAWRALIAEDAIPAAVHRELFAYMTFSLPPGEQFLGYPVAGPGNDLRPGHRRY